MNAQLEHQLRDKYPDLFVDIYGDPQQTCMAWGLECDDGWYTLIDVLCKQIQHHQQWNMAKDLPTVVVEQVKEKFGTLRFYYRGGDDVIAGLVQMAEAMSARTCESCGVPATQTHGGWIRTMCQPCIDSREERRQQELAAYNAKHEDVYKKLKENADAGTNGN